MAFANRWTTVQIWHFILRDHWHWCCCHSYQENRYRKYPYPTFIANHTPLICRCQSKAEAEIIAFQTYNLFVAGYAIFSATFADGTNLIWMPTDVNQLGWICLDQCVFQFWLSRPNNKKTFQIEFRKRRNRQCMIYRDCETTVIITVFIYAFGFLQPNKKEPYVMC